MADESGDHFDLAKFNERYADIIEIMKNEYDTTETGVQGLSIDGAVGSDIESRLEQQTVKELFHTDITMYLSPEHVETYKVYENKLISDIPSCITTFKSRIDQLQQQRFLCTDSQLALELDDAIRIESPDLWVLKVISDTYRKAKISGGSSNASLSQVEVAKVPDISLSVIEEVEKPADASLHAAKVARVPERFPDYSADDVQLRKLTNKVLGIIGSDTASSFEMGDLVSQTPESQSQVSGPSDVQFDDLRLMCRSGSDPEDLALSTYDLRRAPSVAKPCPSTSYEESIASDPEDHALSTSDRRRITRSNPNAVHVRDGGAAGRQPISRASSTESALLVGDDAVQFRARRSAARQAEKLHMPMPARRETTSITSTTQRQSSGRHLPPPSTITTKRSRSSGPSVISTATDEPPMKKLFATTTRA